MRGIRGAVTVEQNTKEEIWQAAQTMVKEILRRNSVTPDMIGAAIFSSTEDLTVRQLSGFDLVPLFDARQCAIEGSLDHCIRVLLLVDTKKGQQEIQHVYLGRAAALRPDLP